jgi:AcrR family transcriptional regulator
MLRGPSTEKHICKIFFEMMKEKSCFKIKVVEFIKYANISRSTFYVYFDSIYDLIQKIEDDFIAGLFDEKNVPLPYCRKDVANSLINTLEYMKKNMNVLQALCGPHGDPEFQLKVKNRLAKFFNRNFGKTVARLPDIERKLMLEFISGGRWQMYIWWIFNDRKVSIQDMHKAIMKVMGQLNTEF